MTPAPPPPQRPGTDVGVDADEGWGDHSWAQAPDLAAPRSLRPEPMARPSTARRDRFLAPPSAGASRVATPVGAPPAQASLAPSHPPFAAPLPVAAPQPRSPQAQTAQPARPSDLPSNPQQKGAPSNAGGSSALDAQRAELSALDRRGLSAVTALLVLAACLAAGIVVDQVVDSGGGLRVGLLVGSLLAVLLVRFRSLFAVVVSPPLAFIVGSAAELVVRSGGVPSRTDLLGFATGWLVYGFPTIAAAAAIVLVIAAVRRALAIRSRTRAGRAGSTLTG